MKFFAYIAGYLVWYVSFLIPRNKKLWAFGSFRGAFADNAKYLFIYVSACCPEVTPVWISYNRETVEAVRQKGLRAYSIFSLRGLWYALRAGCYLYNAYTSDICFFTSGRAVCVNLWHGVGLKKIEFSIDRGPMYNRYVKKTLKERFYYPQVYKRPDYFLSSTPFQSVKFADAFRIDWVRCMDRGYPRNDVLFWEEERRMKFIEKYEPQETRMLAEKWRQYRKVYLYMPTWRESQRNLFSEHLDVEALNELMKEKDSLLVLKPHVNTIVEHKERFAAYDHLLLLEAGIDIYPLLPETDVLITDYSSVLYDYLLMDEKKVILYLYDYREYVNERDFNYPFMEHVAGEIAYSGEELMEIIRSDRYDTSGYTLIRNRFWGNYRGYACEGVIWELVWLEPDFAFMKDQHPCFKEVIEGEQK